MHTHKSTSVAAAFVVFTAVGVGVAFATALSIAGGQTRTDARFVDETAFGLEFSRSFVGHLHRTLLTIGTLVVSTWIVTFASGTFLVDGNPVLSIRTGKGGAFVFVLLASIDRQHLINRWFGFCMETERKTCIRIS